MNKDYITRGTTPTVRFGIGNVILWEEVQEVWGIFRQKGVPLFVLTKEDFTYDPETKKISAKLTQEQTLSLTEKEVLFVQFRGLLTDGTALVGCKNVVKVKGVTKGGVIR